MAEEDLTAEIDRLRAENERLRRQYDRVLMACPMFCTSGNESLHHG